MPDASWASNMMVACGRSAGSSERREIDNASRLRWKPPARYPADNAGDVQQIISVDQ